MLLAFPENVQLAAAKPEAERTPGEQLLAAQVLSINPPRRRVLAALTADGTTRRDELVARLDALDRDRPAQPPLPRS